MVGKDSFVGGSSNKVAAESVTVLGARNNLFSSLELNESDQPVSGSPNKASTVIGSSNTVCAVHSSIIGGNNQVSSPEGRTIQHATIHGNRNTVRADNASIIGNQNQALALTSTLVGYGLTTTDWGQTVIGMFNEVKKKDRIAFAVGTSDNVRKTALAIQSDGQIVANESYEPALPRSLTTKVFVES